MLHALARLDTIKGVRKSCHVQIFLHPLPMGRGHQGNEKPHPLQILKHLGKARLEGNALPIDLLHHKSIPRVKDLLCGKILAVACVKIIVDIGAVSPRNGKQYFTHLVGKCRIPCHLGKAGAINALGIKYRAIHIKQNRAYHKRPPKNISRYILS